MLAIKIIFLISLCSCQGANILGISYIPYHSHEGMQRSFMKELADRDHNLTIFTTNFYDHDDNVKLIHFNESKRIGREIVNQLEYKTNYNMFHQAYNEVNFYYSIIDQQLGQSEVQKLIKEGKKNDFDLLIVECYFFCPMLAFAEIFDCPIIILNAAESFSEIFEILGSETNPVIHPNKLISGVVHGKLTFFERVQSYFMYHAYHLICRKIFDFVSNHLLQKHFPEVTAAKSKIEDRVALIFENSLTTVKPLLPNVVKLNFMHIQPSKPIPEGEVKDFLDSSQKGVIFMSLGSYTQSQDLDSKVIDTLMKVFASLQFEVLWKFEANLSNKSENVMTVSWLPQADVLAHPKLKLFITHGGVMSVQEAIDREVPMIVFPLTYDQPANANELVDKGVACSLDLNTFSEQSLREAISEMMKPKYMSNIRELRRLLNDQPMTSREKAVWYTEFVIRNKGAKHLAYPARNIPFYQRHHYDIILLIMITAYLTLKTMKSIQNRFSQLHSMNRLVAEKKND